MGKITSHREQEAWGASFSSNLERENVNKGKRKIEGEREKEERELAGKRWSRNRVCNDTYLVWMYCIIQTGKWLNWTGKRKKKKDENEGKEEEEWE